MPMNPSDTFHGKHVVFHGELPDVDLCVATGYVELLGGNVDECLCCKTGILVLATDPDPDT